MNPSNTATDASAEVEARCRRAFDGPGPILVHTVGKVGSMTVYRALERAGLPQPIFHIHTLRECRVAQDCERLSAAGLEIPTHLLESQALIRYLRERPEVPVKIVTLVRDPIAREVSVLFEDRVRRAELADETSEVDPQRAVMHLRERLSDPQIGSNNLLWLNAEIRDIFGIDILGEPFAQDRGWQIYRREQCDVLLIRTEELSSVGPEAIAELLGLPEPLAMPATNVRTLLSYDVVKKMLRLDRKTLAAVYDSAPVRHIYGDEQTEKFYKRWAYQADVGAGSDSTNRTASEDLQNAWCVIRDLRQKYKVLHEDAVARLAANHRLVAQLETLQKAHHELLANDQRKPGELGRDREMLRAG